MAQTIGPRELAMRALREANYHRRHRPADRKAAAAKALAVAQEVPVLKKPKHGAKKKRKPPSRPPQPE